MNPFSDLPWLFWDRLANGRFKDASLRWGAMQDAAKQR